MNRHEKLQVIKAIMQGNDVVDALIQCLSNIPSWVVNDCDNDPAKIAAQITTETGRGAKIFERNGKFYNLNELTAQKQEPTWFKLNAYSQKWK